MANKRVKFRVRWNRFWLIEASCCWMSSQSRAAANCRGYVGTIKMPLIQIFSVGFLGLNANLIGQAKHFNYFNVNILIYVHPTPRLF